MSLVFGYADPRLQRILLELCFAEGAEDSDFRQPRMQRLDQALIADVLSGEQLRVLPLLYRTMPLDALSQPSVTKVLGIYKHTLCRNTVMLKRLVQTAHACQGAGFRPMIGIKGLPAIAYVNRGLGARPMADVDILIPELHTRPDKAYAVFVGLGYRIKHGGFRSVTLVSPEGFELDVHWYVQDWALGQELVEAIDAQAHPHRFGALDAFRIPCIEHHLAHTIAHGILNPTLTHDARWIFDTVAVLKQNQPLDPDRFAEFANAVMAPARIRDALAAIATELPETIAIDRDQLWRLHDATARNAWIVSWFYRQNPTPNVPPEQGPAMARIDRIKAMAISYLLVPRWLHRHQGFSFFDYFRWLDAFPPLSQGKAMKRFVGKIFVQGPLFGIRMLFGR